MFLVCWSICDNGSRLRTDGYFVRSNGAEYLGPIIPAVAEICLDLQPTQEVDSSTQKLFRNLWFYIVLYGLAPPLRKTQQSPSSGLSLNSSRSMSSSSSRGRFGANQTVLGPYAWNEEWLCAVKRLTQFTPPLVSIFLLPHFTCIAMGFFRMMCRRSNICRSHLILLFIFLVLSICW